MSNAPDKVTAGWVLAELDRILELAKASDSQDEFVAAALAWAAIKPMADIERLHGENAEAWTNHTGHHIGTIRG